MSLNKIDENLSKKYSLPLHMQHDFTDPSIPAHEVQLRVLRRLGAEKRSLLAAQWSDQIRETAMQGIRDRHREFDDRRVVLEYARITLGKDLFRKAFARELEVVYGSG